MRTLIGLACATCLLVPTGQAFSLGRLLDRVGTHLEAAGQELGEQIQGHVDNVGLQVASGVEQAGMQLANGMAQAGLQVASGVQKATNDNGLADDVADFLESAFAKSFHQLAKHIARQVLRVLRRHILATRRATDGESDGGRRLTARLGRLFDRADQLLDSPTADAIDADFIRNLPLFGAPRDNQGAPQDNQGAAGASPGEGGDQREGGVLPPELRDSTTRAGERLAEAVLEEAQKELLPQGDDLASVMEREALKGVLRSELDKTEKEIESNPDGILGAAADAIIAKIEDGVEEENQEEPNTKKELEIPSKIKPTAEEKSPEKGEDVVRIGEKLLSGLSNAILNGVQTETETEIEAAPAEEEEPPRGVPSKKLPPAKKDDVGVLSAKLLSELDDFMAGREEKSEN